MLNKVAIVCNFRLISMHFFSTVPTNLTTVSLFPSNYKLRHSMTLSMIKQKSLSQIHRETNIKNAKNKFRPDLLSKSTQQI